MRCCCWLVFLLVSVLPACLSAQEKTNACTKITSASYCNARNTCGSPSNPCLVNVKRTGNSASATPSTPEAKGNALFCVQTGTTVTWRTSSQDTGFLVNFGPASPFDSPGSIAGGTKKSVSVKAVKAGCFGFAFQATKSGAVRGMSQAAQGELMVLGDQ